MIYSDPSELLVVTKAWRQPLLLDFCIYMVFYRGYIEKTFLCSTKRSYHIISKTIRLSSRTQRKNLTTLLCRYKTQFSKHRRPSVFVVTECAKTVLHYGSMQDRRQLDPSCGGNRIQVENQPVMPQDILIWAARSLPLARCNGLIGHN